MYWRNLYEEACMFLFRFFFGDVEELTKNFCEDTCEHGLVPKRRSEQKLWPKATIFESGKVIICHFAIKNPPSKIRYEVLEIKSFNRWGKLVAIFIEGSLDSIFLRGLEIPQHYISQEMAQELELVLWRVRRVYDTKAQEYKTKYHY